MANCRHGRKQLDNRYVNESLCCLYVWLGSFRLLLGLVMAQPHRFPKAVFLIILPKRPSVPESSTLEIPSNITFASVASVNTSNQPFVACCDPNPVNIADAVLPGARFHRRWPRTKTFRTVSPTTNMKTTDGYLGPMTIMGPDHGLANGLFGVTNLDVEFGSALSMKTAFG